MKLIDQRKVDIVKQVYNNAAQSIVNFQGEKQFGVVFGQY